jgi:hypothetical protein
MGIFMETMRHVMLDAAVTDATWLSLHTADPGTDGSNEVTGGTPAYARKQGSFDAASGGERDLTSDLTFDVPATTVAWVGLWTAVSGGTFRGSHQVTSEVFGAQGQYVVQAGDTKFSVQDPA